MDVLMAFFTVWLICVLLGGLMHMPGKIWVAIGIMLSLLVFIKQANACETKAPHCWQQADGQIFCEAGE